MTADWSAARDIAILGAGREGRAALRWLRAAAPAARLTVIAEQPPEAEFEAALRHGETLRVEALDVRSLQSFDLVVRSPGVSIYREPLVAARERGVSFTTPTSLWFAAHPNARTICVTGTKGKSTTSALIAHGLRACGLDVQLAGNIGQPLLDCPDADAAWWVVELSSYQIADLEARPELAVLLNLSPEHLDWHGSPEAYMRDKLRLAGLVRPGGLIANAGDAELATRLCDRPQVTWFGCEAGIHVRGGAVFDGDEELPMTVPGSLPGRHNRLNLAAALTAVRLAGADVRVAAAAMASFPGLPHRLQVLGDRHGVTFIDDSIASTPVATAAALEALAGRGVVLLVGGFDRGLDWNRHLPDFRPHPPLAVLGMPENGARILAMLRGGGIACERGMHAVTGLAEGVRKARELARPGDVVLLSPGAPSFPHFADFRARGRAFATLADFAPAEE